jgi:hypothetical protein
MRGTQSQRGVGLYGSERLKNCSYPIALLTAFGPGIPQRAGHGENHSFSVASRRVQPI